MDKNPKCGGCLWYGDQSHDGQTGECKNAESAFYWNRGGGRETIRIAPQAGPCRYYRSARTFLGEDTHAAKPRRNRPMGWLPTHLFQLVYPLFLTGIFFYYFFSTSPESYEHSYTRTESDKLSL